ncbi:MAG: hypothetical protein H6739_16240 [Alphaproteobacteria bacterium]|nr:hypothetical protein [Alphaproteobacteria bacterium]
MLIYDEYGDQELSTFGFDPRVAFRARLVEDSYLKGATGIFTQPPQTFESYHPNPDVRTELDNERAWSTTLGYEHQLTDAISLEVEASTSAWTTSSSRTRTSPTCAPTSST